MIFSSLIMLLLPHPQLLHLRSYTLNLLQTESPPPTTPPNLKTHPEPPTTRVQLHSTTAGLYKKADTNYQIGADPITQTSPCL